MSLLIACGGVGDAIGTATTAAVATTCSNTTEQANGFVNSIGVNVHLGKSNGPYANRAQVQAALSSLGAHHIRDVIQPHNPGQLALLTALGSANVRSDLSVNETSPVAITQRLGVIKSLPASALGSIEGANEWDGRGGPNWPTTLRSAQDTLSFLVRSDPSLSGTTLVAPALQMQTDPTPLGTMAPVSDVGNLHTYPSGHLPEANVQAQLVRAKIENPGQTPWVTESGYQDDLAWSGGHHPASDATQATYIPRLLAEYYRSGIDHTFLYELVDDPTTAGNQAHFGLFDSAWHPKPTAVALSNMIAVLSDPGPAFTPCVSIPSIVGAPTDLHEVVLAKRDGHAEVLLWRAESVWDPIALQPLPTLSSTITIAAPGHSISLSIPKVSALRQPMGRDVATLAVGPDLVIAEIQ